ncbi:hypothetical protein B566_EDAN002243 [Ephemera danica]|nr:hypothetical protein B566_EDAN002243 [Ephemera danica]
MAADGLSRVRGGCVGIPYITQGQRRCPRRNYPASLTLTTQAPRLFCSSRRTMLRSTLLSALSVLGLLMVTNAQQGGRPCLDAARQRGICVTLRDCPSQYQRLQRGTQQDYSFLQRSHCGFSGNSPLTTVGRPEPMIMPNSMQQCGGIGTQLIVGGEETALGEHPWLVALEYTNARLVSIRIGEHDLRTDPDCSRSRSTLQSNICAPPIIRATIERTIRHPQYSSINTQNDIALIRLRDPVAFNQYVSPVCLPGRESLSRNYVGTRQTVIGWGVTEEEIKSNVKLRVTLPVLGNERCEELFRAANENVDLIDTQICAGGEKLKDSCKSDSGGPLLLNENSRWTIVGIVSYGYEKCGVENIPAVYTRVAPYLDWINSNMEP